jgi:hypothetical protein
MGYFGLTDEIKYWSVTCKRCGEAINFAHFDERGHKYDQNCVIAVECPRCREKRRYRSVEVWRHRVTSSPIGTAHYFVTEPIFIKFGRDDS